MAATPTAPIGSNTYVPTLQEGLGVSFSRNEADFPVNKYVQIVPVTESVGYFLRVGREEAGRINDTAGRSNRWADGADRPKHVGENEKHQFDPYRTERWNFGNEVGYKAAKQASFDVKAKCGGTAAEKAMRFRTQQVITALTTSGSYAATHTSAVASITGNSGRWDQSTAVRSDIKRSLNTAAEIIVKDTLNGVKPGDLMLVMSPGCARQISESQEITDYMKNTNRAEPHLRGETRNAIYGCPDELYGFPLIIEDTVKVTSNKGASSVATSYILPATTPVMVSRIGGLVDERLPSIKSFSSVCLFMYEEMTVEDFDDTKNRRYETSITEDYEAQLVASISAYLFTAAVQ